MSESREERAQVEEAPGGKLEFLIGLLLTALILGVATIYVWVRVGMAPGSSESPSDVIDLLLRSSAADIGQFVLGIAGALAFVWLVVAYCQQSRQLKMQRHDLVLQRHELRLQRGEFRRLASEAKAQVDELRQSREVAVRDAFVQALDLYERLLAIEAARIFDLGCRFEKAEHQVTEAWEKYSRGDRYVFFRSVSAQVIQGRHAAFLNYQDQSASGRMLLRSFYLMAQDVLRHAKSADEKLYELCRKTEWYILAELFEKLLVNRDAIAPSPTPRAITDD